MVENFERVRHHLGRSANRQKKYYDKRAQLRQFEPGDWVLRLNPAETSKSKLNFPYMGPYLVLNRVGEVSYQIQRSPQGKKLVVHVDHLKLFDSEDVPISWLRTPASGCASNLQLDHLEPDQQHDTLTRDGQSLLGESSGNQSPPDGSTGREMIPQNDPGSSTLTPCPPRRSRRRRKLPSRLKECVLNQ